MQGILRGSLIVNGQKDKAISEIHLPKAKFAVQKTDLDNNLIQAPTHDPEGKRIKVVRQVLTDGSGVNLKKLWKGTLGIELLGGGTREFRKASALEMEDGGTIKVDGDDMLAETYIIGLEEVES